MALGQLLKEITSRCSTKQRKAHEFYTELGIVLRLLVQPSQGVYPTGPIVTHSWLLDRDHPDMGPKASKSPTAMLVYLRLLRELAVPNFESTLEYGTAMLSRYPRHMNEDERMTTYMTYMW